MQIKEYIKNKKVKTKLDCKTKINLKSQTKINEI